MLHKLDSDSRSSFASSSDESKRPAFRSLSICLVPDLSLEFFKTLCQLRNFCWGQVRNCTFKFFYIHNPQSSVPRLDIINLAAERSGFSCGAQTRSTLISTSTAN